MTAFMGMRQAIKGKALVLDENPRTRDVSAGFMSKLLYMTEVAGAAEEALNTFRRGESFDVVVSDYALKKSGMNGPEFFRAVLGVLGKESKPPRFILISQQRINHGVADEVNLIRRNAFLGQILQPALFRHEEHVRNMVGEDAIHFLGHAAIKRAQTRLHVNHQRPRTIVIKGNFCRYQRASHG